MEIDLDELLTAYSTSSHSDTFYPIFLLVYFTHWISGHANLQVNDITSVLDVNGGNSRFWSFWKDDLQELAEIVAISALNQRHMEFVQVHIHEPCTAYS